MPVTQYFGQPARYHGKPLFHILCNLSQFGKGRIVTRSSYQVPTGLYVQSYCTELCRLRGSRVSFPASSASCGPSR